MRRIAISWVVFVALALGLGGCGERPAAPAAPTAGAGAAAHGAIQLPVGGLLGALPPKDGRVTIEVDAAGGLRVDGRRCAWSDLALRLRESTNKPLARKTKSGHVIFTASMSDVVEEDLEEVEEETGETDDGQEIVAEEPVIEDGEIGDGEIGSSEAGGALLAASGPGARAAPVFGQDGSRNADVLLRIDRRVPWSVAGQVLITCARSKLKLWRMFYAVSGADGRGEGALAVFLPKDRGCPRVEDASPITRVTMTRPEGPGETRPGRLATALRRRLATPTTRLEVHLVARPTTPYEQVLIAMDAAVRAAARGIELEGFAVPEEAPAERCAQPREQATHHWALSGRALMQKPPKSARGPERKAEYVGVVNDLPHGEPEIVEGAEREASGK